MKLQPERGSVEPQSEGLICGAINKEVDLPLARQMQLYNEKWNSGKDTYVSKSRGLQLQFLDRLSLPVLTGTKIKGEKNASLGVALYDVLTGQLVNSGPEASAKLEIVVLEKDFSVYEGDDWSLEEFNSKIVREREGGKTLLTGDSCLTLKAGIGFVGDICFRHNKCWMRKNEFRLGAKTMDGALGLRVREAKTESFIVEDRRGKLYQKHYPPSLSDEVWRLEKIGKDGTFHNRLSKESINMVKDFVTLLNTNRQRLKQIIGMPAKLWNVTVKHAQTCVLDKRAYLYCSPNSQPNTAVVFNVVGQFLGLLVEHEFILADKLSEIEKATADKLVLSAFQQWEQVVLVEDVASLTASSQQLTNAYDHPSTSTTLESSFGGCNFETSDTFDNHSTDVSSLGGASTLDDFSSLAFENLDNTGGVDLESVGQDITDLYLNLDDFGDLPNVLYRSNPVSTGIFDGHAILPSHHLPKFADPRLDVSSHEFVSSIYPPCNFGFLCDYESQSIDAISNGYEKTLTFTRPVTSSSLCDTDSMIQDFRKCNHLQIPNNHSSLQSNDTTSGLHRPQNTVYGNLLADSSGVAIHKAQRTNLSKENAQRRWRMLFSVMRWFSVRRNLSRVTLLEEMHKDINASSQAKLQSVVDDILVSRNKTKRRYLSKKDRAKGRWRMLFSLMRWFSVERKVARKSPFREIPKSLALPPGDITSSIDSKGGMNDLNCGRPLIFPVYGMTPTFSEEEHSQLPDASCFVQSQNSELESLADIHSAVNDAPLACSPAVPISKTHRRHLLKRNKAQRRWRMLFSVVKWFSVRKNVARKTSTEGSPFTLNGLDNFGSLQSTHNTNCSSEEPTPGQATNALTSDVESMTPGFCDNGKLQIFDAHVSLQTQNSNPELQASLHDTINDILLAHSSSSSSVSMNKTQRRYLLKGTKAQRRWRILFSVVRWFSVRRNVARRRHAIDMPKFC